MSRIVTPWNPSRRATARVKDALPAPTVCPHCGGEVKLVSNAEIYGREFGEWPWAFLCAGCRAYVGLHPFTGIPLGTLATAPMRDARQRAKAAFNPLWQSGRMSRTDAYAWLAKELGVPPAECHIGMFDVPQCERVVSACGVAAADDRARFEAWAKSQGMDLEPDTHGWTFADAGTETSWIAWQAATSGVMASQTPMVQVPLEPTPAMLKAASEATWSGMSADAWFTAAYKAMLAAAKPQDRECSNCGRRDDCMTARMGDDCGPGRPAWMPLVTSGVRVEGGTSNG